MDILRECSRCGLEGKHAARTDDPTKPRAWCRDCTSAYQKAYRARRWQRVKARNVWKGMIARCHDPDHGRGYRGRVPCYADYGAKGIRVCDRWRASFEEFLADVGLPPTRNATLDRKNPKRGYTPSNARWVDPDTQRVNRKNSRWVEARDPTTQELHTLILSDWARLVGIDRRTIAWRLDHGWSPDDAVGRPTPLQLASVPF